MSVLVRIAAGNRVPLSPAEEIGMPEGQGVEIGYWRPSKSEPRGEGQVLRLWRHQAMSGPCCPNREELGRNTLDFLSAGPPVCHRRLSLVKPKRKPENPGVSLVQLRRTSSRAQSREGRVERDPDVGAIGQESAQCLRDCSTEISV